MLAELAILLDNSDLKIKLYVETRPEGINPLNLKQLKKLKVDGVGMGIEVSDEDFRMGSLNRFASQILRHHSTLEGKSKCSNKE